MATQANVPPTTTTGGGLGGRTSAPDSSASNSSAPNNGDRGTSAYRRAWWAIACYPITFVAAFVIGEGLYTLLGGDDANPPAWAAPVAATPAILIFALPGLAAVLLGRRAMKLGRIEGRTPAIIGAAIAIGFVGLNLLSYLLQLVAG